MRSTLSAAAFIAFISSSFAVLGCAHVPAPAEQHGVLPATLPVATAGLCEHRVPTQACALCHPELVASFKAQHDWCAPHKVPESQCFICHPDLEYSAMPTLIEGADVKHLVSAGEDLPSLEPHVVPGKITVFDFFAVWCAVCRKVDQHMIALLNQRSDIAHRKINVVTWETPIAARYLGDVPGLPLLIVYGKNGKQVAKISGADLEALDRAIEKGGR